VGVWRGGRDRASPALQELELKVECANKENKRGT
jgi:hypothetical protein